LPANRAKFKPKISQKSPISHGLKQGLVKKEDFPECG